MFFNSIVYFFFLGGVFTLSWLAAERIRVRNFILLVSSLVFYSAWDPRYLPLIITAVFITWISAGKISESSSSKARKLWLFLGIFTALSILAIFKYASFSVTSASYFLDIFGLEPDFNTRILKKIVLPVGISFYTFQAMSYTIDVYRNDLKHEKSFLNYALYVSFFPQLVAGPIVRATDFIPQVKKQVKLDRELYAKGIILILIGLFKKVAIADFIAVNLVDRVFESTTMMSSLESLVGVYGYTLQIYCDFSGYSDIAIGSAALLGFYIPKNFDAPFISSNLSEFWERWHISLSSWLRDYLYIPLGGSRNNTKWKTSRNLMITMVLGGLWHGAAWTFVFWGSLHGIGLVVSRWLGFNSLHKKKIALPLKIFGVFLTFNFTVFAFIFFRAATFSRALQVLKNISRLEMSFVNLPATVIIAIIAGYLIHLVSGPILKRITVVYQKIPLWVHPLLMFAFAFFLQKVAITDVVPFIYFQF
ncbi:MAG: MBOAT family O-acyltransferase [Myxococcota bacterium]